MALVAEVQVGVHGVGGADVDRVFLAGAGLQVDFDSVWRGALDDELAVGRAVAEVVGDEFQLGRFVELKRGLFEIRRADELQHDG